jgi:hypothetical protein
MSSRPLLHVFEGIGARDPKFEDDTIDNNTYEVIAEQPYIYKMSTAELAVSYAALILADDNVDITVCFPCDSSIGMGLTRYRPTSSTL